MDVSPPTHNLACGSRSTQTTSPTFKPSSPWPLARKPLKLRIGARDPGTSSGISYPCVSYVENALLDFIHTAYYSLLLFCGCTHLCQGKTNVSQKVGYYQQHPATRNVLTTAGATKKTVKESAMNHQGEQLRMTLQVLCNGFKVLWCEAPVTGGLVTAPLRQRIDHCHYASGSSSGKFDCDVWYCVSGSFWQTLANHYAWKGWVSVPNITSNAKLWSPDRQRRLPSSELTTSVCS